MLNWLEIARDKAEKRFLALPFPSKNDENYRFTPVNFREISAAPSSPSQAPISIETLGRDEAALLCLEGDVSRFSGNCPGIFFGALSDSVAVESELLQSSLGSQELFQNDKFAQLSASRWRNGAFLRVPKGMRVSSPLRVAVLANGAEEHFRNLVVLEENSEAVLILESWSDAASRFFTELTEIRLGRKSRLHCIYFQNLGESTEAMIRQKIVVGEGAEIRFTPFHLGGSLVQQRQEIRLAGEDSFFETKGAARGEGRQHFDFWLDVFHEAPRSKSQMECSFVMAGKARGVFNALVEVEKGAIDCESSQKSKSLLLGAPGAGGAAVVHAIPKLIIKTDAVKASHGASVSSVSFEQLHYLQSRGIPRAEAERMIVRGFTEGVVERLPGEDLQGRADALLDQKQGGSHV